jgi:hypothetical protein
MKQGKLILSLSIAVCGPFARAQAPSPLPRPDLDTAAPIASCKLQSLPADPQPSYDRTAVLYSLQPPADDPLANYQRTPLGDWQMPAEAERNDPWLRLLVFAPKRPIVTDLAVFVDGKSFREKREAWVDEVLTAAKSPAGAEFVTGNNPSIEPGTNGADKASDNGPPAGEKKDTDKDSGKDIPTGVATQARQAPTMRERLINYLTTNGVEVDRDEIHWLIAEWGAGPLVVVLGPGLSWQRASLAPLLAYLDQDADGGLSINEIAQSHDSLKRADLNGDDVVDVSELRRAATHPPVVRRATGHSLIVPLDANTDWDALAADVVRIYGRDPSPSGEQMRGLCNDPADVTLRVDFGLAKESQKQTHELSVISLGPELRENKEAVVATSEVISLDVGGDFIEFSAAQVEVAGNADASASQLAIGAVVDGNSLERLLDRDQDGRFTLRERQELAGLLAALDDNLDGQVASDEIPTPIRLAVTVGPHVHQLLATPMASARTIAPRDAAPTAPSWFLSMDKNSDRDLSRNEFLGNTEQFRQFDTDGDGLLSVAEALKLNGGQ